MVCVRRGLPLLLLLTLLTACGRQTSQAHASGPAPTANPTAALDPVLGIERTNQYLPLLRGKTVALVVNHTTVFPNRTHLADSLLSLGIKVKTIFAPEHGFRGTATDGEEIADGVDKRTGIAITSLYGSNRKPTPDQLKGIDVVIFDIQDVGTRFYTYTSTMHYVLEACAEQGKQCLVLDRPNPNGKYVDGPVMEKGFVSFVGLNPVPILHGCTVGELAKMIVGEGWLAGSRPAGGKPAAPTTPTKRTMKSAASTGESVGGAAPDPMPDPGAFLTVIPCLNYTHQTPYTLPVAPSPNLPNQQSILLYPSLCLLEPTIVSVGRGTDTQFQVIGGPDPALGSYTFTPADKPGAMNPPQEGKQCYGLDLRGVDATNLGLSLRYVIEMYAKATDKAKFFTSAAYFDKLAGTDALRLQLTSGKSEAEMRKTWQPGLNNYKKIRAKYLLYP